MVFKYLPSSNFADSKQLKLSRLLFIIRLASHKLPVSRCHRTIIIIIINPDKKLICISVFYAYSTITRITIIMGKENDDDDDDSNNHNNDNNRTVLPKRLFAVANRLRIHNNNYYY